VGKNHGNREAQPEESKGIIFWIERLNEIWPSLHREPVG
jgi:hypothetical protein